MRARGFLEADFELFLDKLVIRKSKESFVDYLELSHIRNAQSRCNEEKVRAA